MFLVIQVMEEDFSNQMSVNKLGGRDSRFMQIYLLNLSFKSIHQSYLNNFLGLHVNNQESIQSWLSNINELVFDINSGSPHTSLHFIFFIFGTDFILYFKKQKKKVCFQYYNMIISVSWVKLKFSDLVHLTLNVQIKRASQWNAGQI